MTLSARPPAESLDAGPDVTPWPRFRLGQGIAVVPRQGGLQIGTAPGRRLLLPDPPDDAAGILRSLDGSVAADSLLLPGHDRQWWYRTLVELESAGLLCRDEGPQRLNRLVDERVDLTHRHGAGDGELALSRRSEAVVDVRGSGRVASLVSVLLRSSGIGRVYRSAGSSRSPGPLPRSLADAENRVGVIVRRRSADAAAHQRPTVTVLASDGVPDPLSPRDLMSEDIPHLAVWAGDGRARVGPMVLPSRSCCLWCVELVKTDNDPEWPQVRLHLAQALVELPSTVLTAGAASLAVAEVLHLVEGFREPLTVGGTLEWDATSLPRRRSWPLHPRCSCSGDPAPR